MENLVKGIVPPMITVFKKDESLDEQGTRDHVNFLIDNNVHAIAPGGSTGEMIAMTLEEREKLIEMVIEEAKGRVPIYPGTMHYSTDLTIRLSKFAENKGAEGVLVIPPYYLNPPKHDAMNHFRDLRQAIDLPIILYDNVWFSGYEFNAWEVAQLVEEDVLQGIKCAHGDPWKVHTLKHLCGDKLVVYYGHDVNGLEALLVGGDGWLTGGINLIPKECVELFEAAQKGRLDEARKLWDRLIPLINFICIDRKDNYPHFVQVFKDGLNMRGRSVGVPRKPLNPLREPEREKLRQILDNLGLL